MKAPPNLQYRQSYLGLANHLNRFSSKLADLTAPLRAPCKKGVVYASESSQQEEFEAIKREISRPPVLAYFDKSKTSVVKSDASKKGFGAVLSQESNPVVYTSKSLIETEQRYLNIERGLLNVVFALERFHHYLCGYTVTVQTDHHPLVSIWKKYIASNSIRLQRLLPRGEGKENVIADALSSVSPQPVRESKVDRDASLYICLLKKSPPIQQL